MKVIAIGDPHFKVTNIPDVNLFIDRITQFVEQENPDLVVILGDVLDTHERLHTSPFNKAIEFVQKIANISETFILVGNHDAINNQIFLEPTHWMNCLKYMKNLTVVDTVLHKYIDDYHFTFVPYVPPSRFIEALNTNPEDWKTSTCIFAHQEFYGCKMGAIISADGDKWEDHYPNIVSGHIHSNQTLNNIYYCGSAMQNAFGESERNIIPVLTWETSELKYKLREHDLDLPRKRIVYTDIADIEDIKVPEADPNSDKIKITVSGVYDDFKAFKKTKKYKDIIKTGTKVVFKPKREKKEEDDKNPDPVDETDFNKILSMLVLSEKNSHLYQAFEMIVNNKEIEDDILFL
jgi:DNA repair exonuclease SbcCD nuclease subunit